MKTKVRPRSKKIPHTRHDWGRFLGVIVQNQSQSDPRMQAAGQGVGGPEERDDENEALRRRARGY